MNSDVSVIIPVYNGARFIERTIESVLRQTLAPKEIIIVDDASTDETRRCIERVAADHTFIQVPENRGVCHSRNAGIRASTSPLIALSDQDDLWHPEKLARQVAAFEAHPSIELLFTNFNICGMRYLTKAINLQKPRLGSGRMQSNARRGTQPCSSARRCLIF